MLGAQANAAIGVIPRPECQAIRATLLVIEIGKFARLSEAYGSGARGGRRGDARSCGYRSCGCGRCGGDHSGGSCGCRADRGRHAPAAEIDRAVGRIGACAQDGEATGEARGDGDFRQIERLATAHAAGGPLIARAARECWQPGRGERS